MKLYFDVILKMCFLLLQISSMMPQLLQQMQNPSVQQLMSNPEALQAIMQVAKGKILRNPEKS